jgi:hypothetical protein
MRMPTTDQNDLVVAPVKKTVVKPAAKRVPSPVAQTAPGTAPKRVVKAAPQTALKAVAAATRGAPVATKSDKRLKAKKPKLVRERFTLPKLEYLMLDALKIRTAKLGGSVKKSALVRAGIKALAAMSDASFLTALKAVPAIKADRASKN